MKSLIKLGSSNGLRIMIFVQFLYIFFFYDQPLDLFSYMWVLSIQWLILKKKIVRLV